MKRLLRASLVAAVILGGLVPRIASAQQTGFAVEQFAPSERGSDWFTGESLDLRGNLRGAVGLVTDWAHDPLVFRNSDGSERSALLSDSVYAHLGGALTLWDRLRVGIDVPVALYQTGQTGEMDGASYTPAQGAAFGDIRVGVDVRVFGRYGEPLSVAIGAQAYLPTGSQDSYTSDGNFRFAPRVLAAGRLGVFAYSARFGAVIGSASDFAGANTGTELLLGVTAGVMTLHDRLILGPEIFGSTGVGNGATAFSRDDTPLEALGGAHYLLGSSIRAGAGAGAGITPGYGSPLLRVVASLEWAPGANPPPPAPMQVEPIPSEPLADADTDGDGIPDAVDACPTEKGVDSPDPRKRGCPVLPDRDGDAIADANDACPDVVGVATNDPKTNGCPADTDGDGIADAVDACPKEPGRPSDDPRKNGCPRAVLADNKIRITEQIRFRVGSAELDPASDLILGDVLEVLRAHPEVGRMSIEGHTDTSGDAELNRRLSIARAASVRGWLVSRGIEHARLTSRGFGETRPIMSNDTEDGRRSNRRVEFVVVESTGAPQALR